MYRLHIDLRTESNAANSSINEERDFETASAAESYYHDVRADFAKRGGKIISHSQILQHLGGSQAQFWTVCRLLEENVKREFVWWKK